MRITHPLQPHTWTTECCDLLPTRLGIRRWFCPGCGVTYAAKGYGRPGDALAPQHVWPQYREVDNEPPERSPLPRAAEWTGKGMRTRIIPPSVGTPTWTVRYGPSEPDHARDQHKQCPTPHCLTYDDSGATCTSCGLRWPRTDSGYRRPRGSTR